MTKHQPIIEPPAIAPEYMRVEKAAEWLGCHRQTLHRYVREGRIPVLKLGRMTMFRTADLRALIEPPKPEDLMRAGLRAERQAASERAAQLAHDARMSRLLGGPVA